ncbi:glycoside hydrolase family 18 protein [Wolfiporia cocos MD-104 SS10]|uniref:chitinase n=1 Tax=Wolfiporia cocos (strain MD-104) TaxID=742152 RepID=A0A2H3JZQ2_WOLCO|nr:glycoside hydrolase family 18 protein [Wolfiporia cocos MD-104 SS10]
MVLSRSSSAFWLGLSALASGLLPAYAYDNSASDNRRDAPYLHCHNSYWGQNSYGATGTNTAYYQQNLSYYCQDDVINAFPIAFLNVFFGEGGEPSIDLANICSTANDPVFEGTQLPVCTFMASDIETCQSAGKIVTISLGGATGSAGFSNESQAEEFANTIWNLFLGGSSDIRPFGDAVLDGVDLDIEGGSTEYFTNFVSTLRGLMNGGDKSYYLTAAPQCPFPDAYIGSVINAESFDAIYVQFYNNYCELTNYDDSNDWDYSTWDNWAKNTSPNPNVKIYIGAPAAQAAAGSGYVDAATLGAIAVATQENYSSFGGIMLWDASQAYANDRYDEAVKSYLTGGSGASTTTTEAVVPPTTTATATSSTPTTTSSTPTTTSSTPTTTTTASTGDCAGVAAWVANVAYTAGDQVVYNWTDDGTCTTTGVAVGTFVKVAYQSKEAPLNVGPKVSAVPNLSLSSALAAKTAPPTRRNSRFFRF